MPRNLHYSPRISLFLVRVLYHEARRRRMPMTVLANRILEDGLAGSDGWRLATTGQPSEVTPASPPTG